MTITRIILTGAAALAVTVGLCAQQTASVHSKKGVPVQFAGTYRVADGAWIRGSSRSGSRVLYNCTTPGNYYGTVGNSNTQAADQLWIDEGKIPDINVLEIDQINGFDFAYCSTDLTPMGNSGSIRIVFYDDYVPCTTPPAPTCDYLITGLPMSSTGNTQCWGVAIDLEGGSECSTDDNAMFRTTDAGVVDRYFGWGFGSNPGRPMMNDTGPILDLPCPTPLQNCIGSGGFVNSGNENLYWWEDPTGIWTGCYWFGGDPYASFSMKMYAGARNAFAYGHYNNTLRLVSTDFAAGSTVTFTASGHTLGHSLYLLASPNSGFVPLHAGVLVLSTNFYPGSPYAMNPVTGGLTASVSSSIYVAYLQAAETSGPPTVGALVALSNGLYCVG